MIIKMICPRCGASMEIDEKQETFTCSHCGYQEVNVAEKIEVTHRVDHSNEPNLYISYHTSNPAVHMVTRIVSTGQKNTYVDGQEMSFHLPAGEQVIVLKIGKKNYNRKVVIPLDNQPVRISASFSGRANIGIDQPPVTGGIAGGNAAGGGVSGASSGKKRPSGLSIAAFVLSLTFFLSPLAVLLGALDLFLSKKKSDERHHHGMSVAALIIGLILTVIMISTRISSCNRERERKREYEQFQKEQSEAAETENESIEARMDTLRWPKGELGDKVPKPDSERGFVEWENASGFYLYIGGMDEAAFRGYADRLYDSGFKVKYSRGDTYYRADDADGDHVSIDYKGDGIVSLRADLRDEEEPEETEIESSTEKPETSEEPETSGETENIAEDTVEAGVTEADTDPETETETKPEESGPEDTAETETTESEMETPEETSTTEDLLDIDDWMNIMSLSMPDTDSDGNKVNHTIERDGNMIVVKIWQDGLTELAGTVAQNKEVYEKTWNDTVVESFRNMSASFKNGMDQVGFTDYNVSVMILNDQNTDLVLLAFMNDQVIYNIIDEN